MHRAFLSFPFNFLAMFVCLFEFRFFFSWFHWWIWSISSLPCQWKTHQPFVQADIPVSIICAKRLHLLLVSWLEGTTWEKPQGLFPPCRLLFPNRFSGMEGVSKLTPEGLKLPFLSSRIILNSVASKNWAFHVWGSPRIQLRAERGVAHSSFSHTNNEGPLLNSHFCPLRHKITISLCPLKSWFLMRFSNTKACSVCSKQQWDLILYSLNWSARGSSTHGSFSQHLLREAVFQEQCYQSPAKKKDVRMVGKSGAEGRKTSLR